ncbi:MAG: N-formylmaleamate deformylase [Pseudonocardiales bacterium]|nr:N-formylmaleamate deformylase [Pseudonocardiales bacterium]
MTSPPYTSVMVEANGLQHRVLQFGEPGAQDLLLLPGITMPALGTAFIARALTDRFRVSVPDLRGRGESDRAPSGGYTLRDYAADADGVIEALELTRPVVLGHSLGARIAAAHATLFDRSRIGAVVLVDPPTTGPGRPPYPTPRSSFVEQLAEARRGTTVEELRTFYPRWPVAELELRVELLPTCDEDAVMESYTGFENEDFLSLWEQLEQPALLIRGSDSPVVTAADAEELHRRNSAIPLAVVPAAGHMVPWDNLPGFLQLLHEHLPLPSRRG